MTEKENLRELFQKYRSGAISLEELTNLYKDMGSSDDRVLWEEVLEEYYTEMEEPTPDVLKQRAHVLVTDVWDELHQRIVREQRQQRNWKIRRIYRYAAAAILILSLCGVWYVHRHQPRELQVGSAKVMDVPAGKNSATLTLTEGSAIALSDRQGGVVVNAEGITYDDGTIVTSADEVQWCTLSTPRGGQYQITLADGTQVWLNAATTLRYPTKFSGDQRYVEVEGEAFFQVRKMKDKPFVVSSGHQQVAVLGTSFNVNAYQLDGQIRTTLVTGKVKIVRGQDHEILSPGQQSVVGADGPIQNQRVIVDDIIAWKDGYFMFNSEPLAEVMNRVSNWYNIDVEFASPALKNEKVYGSISRSESLLQVLKMLEKTGVANFDKEGNTVKVGIKK